SQARPGFEADKWVLNVWRRSGGDRIAFEIDEPVQSFAFGRGEGGAPGGEGTIAGVVDRRGTEALDLFHYEFRGVERKWQRLAAPTPGVRTSAQIVPPTRLVDRVVYVGNSADRPAEIYLDQPWGRESNFPKEPVRLTHHNDPLLADLD